MADTDSTNLCECGCGQTPVRPTSRFVKGHFSRVAHPNHRHGHARHRDETVTYRTWSSMLQRCRDPNSDRFYRYGGRGIKVCKRWERFTNFLADMGPKPPGMTLERKDPDGDYTPSNCVWASRLAQANNKSSNLKITAFGKTMTASRWARELGIKATTLRARINSGWTPEDAVSIPCGARPPKTHCKRGHELTADNVYQTLNRAGSIARHCKECARLHKEKRRRASGARKQLTEEKVRSIRQRLDSGERVQNVTVDHGVSVGTVYLIRRRKIWSHV